MAFMCSLYPVKCRITFAADGTATVLADLLLESVNLL